jgi:putative FmdB family regulatory protein
MPIYEYRCGECGVFEVMQRITEKPLRRCPKCKSRVERIVSQTSFVLKGSGWYVTDYSRKSTADKTDGAGAGDAAKAGASPADSKADGAAATPSASSPAGGDKSTAAKPSD